MKKLAIGCVGLVALVVVVGGGILYYGYRQVRSTVSQFAELGHVSEIESTVRVRGPFTPPASGELTAGQIERLVRVQTHVREQLGQRFAELDRKYKSLSEKKDATITDVPALIAAYRDVAKAWIDAKRSQVEALNEAGLSLDEYRWIRNQAYIAIGVPFADLDVGKIAAQIRSGTQPTGQAMMGGAVGPAGPEANRKLVEKFKKRLADNVALASFGL